MIQLKVNGVERSFDGDPNMPLLWYLRDVLGLTEPSTAAAWRCAERALFIRTGKRSGHA